MNETVKTKWCEELESGKYQQCDGYLHIGNGYCCLGVLTDIYLKVKRKKWDRFGSSITGIHRVGDSTDLLPKEVIKWAGLTEDDPKVKRHRVDGQSCYTLSALNDAGMDFKKIAKIIRNEL